MITLMGQFLKQVEVGKKGFPTQFPQSSGDFSFPSKQPEAIKRNEPAG
ncbi:MAG: hypothetical protein P8O10_07215 [Pseudorhodobacter sp.]|nr:hypothetical protein [Pseudorhodobacter sp.]